MITKCKFWVIILLLGIVALSGALGFSYFSHQDSFGGEILSAQVASSRTAQFINEKFFHNSQEKVSAEEVDALPVQSIVDEG